jgi:hypothetical protein
MAALSIEPDNQLSRCAARRAACRRSRIVLAATAATGNSEVKASAEANASPCLEKKLYVFMFTLNLVLTRGSLSIPQKRAYRDAETRAGQRPAR